MRRNTERGPEQRGTKGRLAASLATVILGATGLTGCGDQVAGPRGVPPEPTTAASPTYAATLPDGWPTERPIPPSSPRVTTGDADPVTPWVESTTRPGTADGPPCAAAALRVTVDGWDAAMGARGARLTVTNVSGATCLLDAYPTLRLLQGGGDLEIRTVRGMPRQSMEATYPARAPHRLAPGASAWSALEWRSGVERPDYSTKQELFVEVGANGATGWVGAVLTPFEASQPAPSAPFDLNSYDPMSVTAWSGNGAAVQAGGRPS